MDGEMKKKLMGVGAAALAAFVFGESQIMEMDERLQALEELHPEMAQEKLDEVAEELQSEEEAPPALGKPGMSAPPLDPPDHLELNENDEWVAPPQEGSDEIEED
jgi:hypothetical protein